MYRWNLYASKWTNGSGYDYQYACVDDGEFDEQDLWMYEGEPTASEWEDYMGLNREKDDLLEKADDSHGDIKWTVTIVKISENEDDDEEICSYDAWESDIAKEILKDSFDYNFDDLSA